MATPSIVLTGLSKRYPGTTNLALDAVSLAVHAGEVYGFLGANGAGKTTAIRTLLGFLYPTSGSASICGLDIVRDSVAIKKCVGYLAGDVALYLKLTGRELLTYLSDLSGSVDKAYRDKLVEQFDAELDKPIGELSRGNRQKLGIIQAFMHRPDVLIMDEPTSGLDPLMQEAFFALIQETKARGAAIFMSNHIFSEVQRCCDRIGIIRSGKLVKEQTVADISNGDGKQFFTVTFADKVPLAGLATLNEHNVIVTNKHGNEVELTVEGDIAPLLAFLGTMHVTKLISHADDLEREFLQFYEDGSAS